MNRAVFLDRDGVINRKPEGGGYVTSWDEIDLLPNVARAINLFNGADFRVVVVTNQRCVAKGLITEEELDSIHQRLRAKLMAAGGRIDAIYYCPHEEYPPCECRKPKTGMLLEAAQAHRIDLPASWLIGDSERDIRAGRNAGCRTARILTEGGGPTSADVMGTSLLPVARAILRCKSGSRRP